MSRDGPTLAWLDAAMLSSEQHSRMMTHAGYSHVFAAVATAMKRILDTRDKQMQSRVETDELRKRTSTNLYLARSHHQYFTHEDREVPDQVAEIQYVKEHNSKS